METSIYLIRHGQTDWNKDKIFRGRADVPLNERGRKEAQALSRHLEHVRATACYASPLGRTIETAGIVARPHSLEVRIDDRLIDLDFGEWQGKPETEVKKTFPELFKKWHQEPHRARFPGGESLAMVRKRALASLEHIRAENPGGVVFVVSHRVVTKVLMAIALGLSNSAFGRFRQDNCAYNIIELSDDGMVVTLMNDTCHLRSADTAPSLGDF